jgi:hypothetical protein
MESAKGRINSPNKLILALLVLAMMAVGCGNPKPHYLTKAPDPEGIEIAKFEGAYFTYLGTLTSAIIAGLLALLFLVRLSKLQRISLTVSAISFVCAIGLVTLGYASRNLWVVGQEAFSTTFTNLDFYFIGPLTALLYVVGALALILGGVAFFLKR